MVQGMRSKEDLEQIIEDELAKKNKFVDLNIEGMVCGPDGCS